MERESRTLSTAGDTDDVLKVEKGTRNKKLSKEFGERQSVKPQEVYRNSMRLAFETTFHEIDNS